ncbi:MAG: hypothetical protein GX800_00995, partial [Clostridiaceae bacterium]|nr:hypothetical protein [Clostridiaceae bacterium]
DDDTEYKIGDGYYKVDPNIIAADELDLQDEGIFYLDIFGRIAYYDAQSTINGSYAYVIDSYVDYGGFDKRLQIKAFTFEGELVPLTGASRITVSEGDAPAVSYKSTDAGGFDFDGLLAEIPTGTVITFDVNSQGEVNQIGLPVDANNQVDLNYFSEYETGTAFDYRANTGIIRVNSRSVEIDEDTIIMIANTAFEDDDFDLIPLNLLGEEDIYQANTQTTVYNVDRNMVAGLIVINVAIDVKSDIEAAITDEVACAGTLYYNDTDNDINPVFVVAHYRDNKMVEIVHDSLLIGAKSCGNIRGMITGAFENGDTVKAMLIDSFDNAKPLATTVAATAENLPDVCAYKNTVVDHTDTLNKKIVAKVGDSISFRNNFSNSFSQLFDAQGNAIDWSLVNKNDVISVKTVSKNGFDINVCTLCQNNITGEVTDISQQQGIKIDNTYYQVDNQNVFNDDLSIGDSGIFYLDKFSQIAFYIKEEQNKYSYVIDSIVDYVSFNEVLSIKMFTQNNEVAVYTCASSVSLIEHNGTTTYSNDGEYNFSELREKIPAGSVVSYNVNFDGEINTIILPGQSTQNGVDYFAQYATDNTFDYRGSTGMIIVNGRSVEIAEDTIIMIANTAFEDDDFDLLSLNLLGSEDIFEYVNTTAYDVDENMVAGLIIINGQIDVASRAEGLALVTGTSQIKDDYGDDLDRLTVLQGGASKQIDVSDALPIDGILFKAIAPTLNAKGLMSSFKTIAAVDAIGNLTTGNGFYNDDYIEYVVGKVVDKTGSRIAVDGKDGDGNAVEGMLYSIPYTANIYLYNDSVSNRALKALLVDDLGIFDVDGGEYFDEYGNYLDEVDVLISWYDGVIQDVVIYLDTKYTGPAV